MKTFKAIIMTVALGIIFSAGVLAQPPMPTDPTAGGNQARGGTPPGAPIAPGTGILLVLAAGYGLVRVFGFKNVKAEETI